MTTKRFVVLAAVLAVSLLLVAACSGTPATPPPLNLTLRAEDIKYDTTTITAKVGQQVNVTYTNAGALDHTFLIDGLVEEKKVTAGQTINFSFTPNAAGAFQYYCNVAGHKEAGMVGTLTVTP